MAIGDTGKKAAILLSRQPLRPTRTSPWVKRTVEAVEWVRENNLILISSVGMQTWELVTALVSMYSLPLRLHLPVLAGQSFSTIREHLQQAPSACR